MRNIYQVHPSDFEKYNSRQIRENFLLDNLLKADAIEFVYTHYDRMMVGATMPVNSITELGTYEELKADHFLARRELGIVSIGGKGIVLSDDQKFDIEKYDCLYLGRGQKKVSFQSISKSDPAKFILFSCPAHKEYPNRLMKPGEATATELGSLANNNHRAINKYIHADGIQSCQLVLGITRFREGSIWNTMPPHTHDRRMEAYFYFDLPTDQRIIHFMGKPDETRHIFLDNEQGIVSPTWSIHSGVATASYSFIWAMAGENLAFTDMDQVALKQLV